MVLLFSVQNCLKWSRDFAAHKAWLEENRARMPANQYDIVWGGPRKIVHVQDHTVWQLVGMQRTSLQLQKYNDLTWVREYSVDAWWLTEGRENWSCPGWLDYRRMEMEKNNWLMLTQIQLDYEKTATTRSGRRYRV